jgi:hypothetical protein
MDTEAYSESLAFPQVKKRAVASRSFRTKISPSNGSLFTAGSTINIDLPGNLAGQYYNFNQMYLKFTMTLATESMILDRGGAAGCIKRIQIQTAGAQIYDLNNWNVLATALLDTDSSCEWKASSGNVLMGTLGDQLQGELVPVATPRTFCVPMMLNPFSMTTPHRLIPAFSLGSLQFKITLESNGLFGKQTSVAVSAATYTDVEMVCLMTELSPGAQAQIDQMTGGQYNILANSYINSQASLAAAATQLTANLGVSVSSLERIIVVHRPDASHSALERFNLGNRATANLTEFQFLINSENYPQRPILVNNKGAEAYAELLIADHSLVDFRRGNPINNSFAVRNGAQVVVGGTDGGYSVLSGNAPGLAKPAAFMINDSTGASAGTVSASGAANAAALPSTIGTFICSCEFESGLSDGKSSHIYSGISTIASNIQYKGTYGTAPAACTLDFFAQHTIMMSLDMRGQGVWSVSV